MGYAEVIVDASALLAVMLKEDDAELFHDALDVQGVLKFITPINAWEVTARLIRLGEKDALGLLGDVLDLYGITIASIGEREYHQAVEAQSRFGKGNHPAQLNMGDCFAYALARTRGEPLLYKGNDFARTDVATAV